MGGCGGEMFSLCVLRQTNEKTNEKQRDEEHDEIQTKKNETIVVF